MNSVETEFHIGDHNIVSFRLVRTIYAAPMTTMIEIINRVAKKVGVEVEEIDEG